MNRRYEPKKVMGNKQGQILKGIRDRRDCGPGHQPHDEVGRTRMIRQSSSGDTNIRHTEV